MIETTRGLPNTCWICGEPAGETWWADSVDAARSGQGVCERCVESGLGPPKSVEIMSEPKAADELTLIVGVGEATAERLQTAGMRTFADLAGASLQDLVAIVPRASIVQVQYWVEQARDLVRKEG